LQLQQYALFRAIHKGGVFHDIEGSTKEEIITNTAKRLQEQCDWDGEVIAELLLDREKLMPTAIGEGIAVPHTRDLLMDTHFDIVAVVFPKVPLDYGALDGKPVHTLFFLFACEDRRHLNLIAKIAHLASLERTATFLEKRPSKPELLYSIKQWESSINKKY
jgi:PTS system nitrogen regulatory IIA component